MYYKNITRFISCILRKATSWGYETSISLTRDAVTLGTLRILQQLSVVNRSISMVYILYRPYGQGHSVNMKNCC